jgi:hypothetical protein
MKYVINPYITTNDTEMNKVADWIKSIKDKNILRLLAIGIYADKLSIISRNGVKRKKFNIDITTIYDQLLSCTELKNNEGTLYINCAGYLWNLYDVDIKQWREIRKSILDNTRDLRNIYGVTHILLQASNFYTNSIDSNEYSKELEIVNGILKDYRKNNYKNISIDLLCELSLCLKYADRQYKEFEFAKEYLNSINYKDNIIYTTSKTDNYINDIINNEHTNALFILLNKTNTKI